MGSVEGLEFLYLVSVCRLEEASQSPPYNKGRLFVFDGFSDARFRQLTFFFRGVQRDVFRCIIGITKAAAKTNKL